MTDTTTPDPAALASELATLRSSLADLQADNARLASESLIVAKGANESRTALAALTTERDAFKQQVADLEPRAKLAADLEIKVTGYVNAGRESALVEALRAKMPGAEPLAIRGVLTTLHDAGKINRFAEDTAATVAAALPIITAEAPSLLRPPTGASGSSQVRSSSAAAAAPPVSLFRPNTNK